MTTERVRLCSDNTCAHYGKPLGGPDGWTCPESPLAAICNVCDAIDPYVKTNAAGYCAECMGAKEDELNAAHVDGDLTSFEYEAQFAALHEAPKEAV